MEVGWGGECGWVIREREKRARRCPDVDFFEGDDCASNDCDLRFFWIFDNFFSLLLPLYPGI